jgi:hypothetical protein
MNEMIEWVNEYGMILTEENRMTLIKSYRIVILSIVSPTWIGLNPRLGREGLSTCILNLVSALEYILLVSWPSTNQL